MKPYGAVIGIALCAAGCGYHVGGKADLIPKSVRTIAIPTFANGTVRVQVASQLAADVVREFHARTKYEIVTDPGQADAVLSGTITNFSLLGGTTTDPVSGRGTSAQVIITMQINLTDKHTGKLLYTNSSLEFRERYEVSGDLKTYFDESGTAMKRVSKDAARSVVTAILEAF